MTLPSDLDRLGGLARRSHLRELGHTEHALRCLIAPGGARPLRRSWLAAPSADPRAVRAIELGGVLSGESALRSLGVWVSHDTGLCIAVPPTASRLPAPRAGEYRVVQHDFTWPRGWRTDLLSALVVHVQRVETLHAIASIDSALYLGLLLPDQLSELFARLPRRFRRLRTLVDGRCESGIESILRVAAILEGWSVDVQVTISGVGRVDLLINGWLVIEADGDNWHSTREQRERDRVRDAGLVRLGLRSHRFGYRQVMHDLPGCIAVIREYLLAGRPAPRGNRTTAAGTRTSA
jgi:very-short-patch-repair endonuclease